MKNINCSSICDELYHIHLKHSESDIKLNKDDGHLRRPSLLTQYLLFLSMVGSEDSFYCYAAERQKKRKGGLVYMKVVDSNLT